MILQYTVVHISSYFVKGVTLWDTGQESEGDLDALEACAGAVAWGDLAAEAPGALSELSLRRLFRLAQLTCEYLLHVQDCLVWEVGLLKVGSLQQIGEPSCCEASFEGNRFLPQHRVCKLSLFACYCARLERNLWVERVTNNKSLLLGLHT